MQEPSRPVFCLIIEDNLLIGLDLADALDASGYYVAGEHKDLWGTKS
jgi:hypothetical protein